MYTNSLVCCSSTPAFIKIILIIFLFFVVSDASLPPISSPISSSPSSTSIYHISLLPVSHRWAVSVSVGTPPQELRVLLDSKDEGLRVLMTPTDDDDEEEKKKKKGRAFSSSRNEKGTDRALSDDNIRDKGRRGGGREMDDVNNTTSDRRNNSNYMSQAGGNKVGSSKLTNTNTSINAIRSNFDPLSSSSIQYCSSAYQCVNNWLGLGYKCGKVTQALSDTTFNKYILNSYDGSTYYEERVEGFDSLRIQFQENNDERHPTTRQTNDLMNKINTSSSDSPPTPITFVNAPIKVVKKLWTYSSIPFHSPSPSSIKKLPIRSKEEGGLLPPGLAGLLGIGGDNCRRPYISKSLLNATGTSVMILDLPKQKKGEPPVLGSLTLSPPSLVSSVVNDILSPPSPHLSNVNSLLLSNYEKGSTKGQRFLSQTEYIISHKQHPSSSRPSPSSPTSSSSSPIGDIPPKSLSAEGPKSANFESQTFATSTSDYLPHKPLYLSHSQYKHKKLRSPSSSIMWGEKKQKDVLNIQNLLQFQIYDLGICGVDLMFNNSSNWAATVDIGSECLSVPSFIFSRLMAWLPVNCPNENNDNINNSNYGHRQTPVRHIDTTGNLFYPSPETSLCRLISSSSSLHPSSSDRLSLNSFNSSSDYPSLPSLSFRLRESTSPSSSSRTSFSRLKRTGGKEKGEWAGVNDDRNIYYRDEIELIDDDWDIEEEKMEIDLNDLLITKNNEQYLCIVPIKETSPLYGSKGTPMLDSPVKLGSMALTNHVIVLDSENAIIGFAPRSPLPSRRSKTEGCNSKAECRGQQSYFPPSNVCLDPNCEEWVFKTLDDASKNCQYAPLSTLAVFVTIPIIMLFELYVNEFHRQTLSFAKQRCR